MTSPADHEQRIAAALEANLRQATGRALRLGAGVLRLTGGFDTETYAFRLDDAPDAPDALAWDLVVRLFRGPRESHRVHSEAAIQNHLAHSYPAPPVPIDTAGLNIMGRPYLVMRRLPGRSLLEVLRADPAAAGDAGALLGAAQARLHSLDVGEALRALASFDLTPWTPGRLLADIRDLAEATGDPMLTRLERWLDPRRPSAPRPSLCHGDFHPGNVLVQDMRLTGVIDWTNFALAPPEFDVAISRLILSIGLVALDSDDPGPELLRRYDAAYRAAARGLDERLVRYYAVLRAGRALARTVARRYRADMRGAAPDGYAWSGSRAQAAIRALIRAETGLEAGESKSACSRLSAGV